jgi:hypothetical protein
MFSSFARARLAAATFIFAISAGAGLAAGPNGTIGAAMPNTKGKWYTPELYGITDQAKKLGYEVIIQDAGGYANVDRQVTQVSHLIAQRVRALLLDAADPAAVNWRRQTGEAGQNIRRRRWKSYRGDGRSSGRRGDFQPLHDRPRTRVGCKEVAAERRSDSNLGGTTRCILGHRPIALLQRRRGRKQRSKSLQNKRVNRTSRWLSL